MNEQRKNWGKNRDIFRWYRWIRLIGITLAVYIAMEYILPVVFPFCVGFLIASILYPLRRRLERRLHMRREAAGYVALFTGILVSLLIVCGVGYGMLAGGSYMSRRGLTDQLVVQGRTVWNDCCERLHTMTGRWIMEKEDYRVLISSIRDRSIRFDPVSILDNWKNVSSSTLRVMAYTLVTVVSALLMINGYEQLIEDLGAAVRGLFHDGFGQAVRSVGTTYIKAQLIIMTTITTICVVGLFVARQPNFLLIGVAIGICDALPFLGTGICFLPWALWRFFTGRYATGAWFVLLYVVTSFTRQAMEPRLIGKKIGVPPLAVLVSIYVGVKVYSKGGFLLGPVSAFLIWQIYSGKAAQEDAYADDNETDRADDCL